MYHYSIILDQKFKANFDFSAHIRQFEKYCQYHLRNVL